MSSYVAVTGTPAGETCCIFGLTPQEMRYLQSKFPERMKEEPGWNPAHGIRLECACVVVLNALGYIGFKVISSSGDRNEFLWTLERNLDMDTHYQLPSMSTPPCCYYDRQRRKSSNCLSAQSPDMDYGVRYHSSSSLSKYHSSLSKKTPSASNLLVPPQASNQRRHSIGERLAAALHIGSGLPDGKRKSSTGNAYHKDSF